jgi:predicted acyl esterase
LPDAGAPFELDSIFSEIPLATHPLIQEAAAFYREWLAHATADSYWHPISAPQWYEQVDTPVLNIAGWYDAFLESHFSTIGACVSEEPPTTHAATNA